MNKKFEKYTNANRLAWNEVMPRHQKAVKNKWDRAFSKPGFTCIKGVESDLLKSVGLSGEKNAHPLCNNGVELLSLKNMGASECVGFDISDEAIKEAKARAMKYDIPCHFLCTDVYGISQQYHNRFDIVYISVGSLGWMPDLALFFQKASALLNDSGIVFIHEMHPFAEMLSTDDLNDADPLKIIEPYFKKKPYIENKSLDYLGQSQYEAQTQYWFIWTMSDITMSIISNGLTISHFSEYKQDVSSLHKKNEKANIDIPLSYIIIAEKS